MSGYRLTSSGPRTAHLVQPPRPARPARPSARPSVRAPVAFDAMSPPPRRVRVYSHTAAQYARGRPDYPGTLVDWVAPQPANVVDVAAGTGALTGRLLAGGHRVVAVEPVAEMLDQLRARHPAAIAVQALAEALPLRTGSADVVTIAQALHWLDPTGALDEVARVLRPGGTVLAAYNLMDTSVPWVRRLGSIVADAVADAPQTTFGDLEPIADHPAFGPIETATFRHWHAMTRAQLEDLVASYAGVASRPPDERAELARRVDAFFTATSPGLRLQMPYRTEAVKAVVAG